MRLNPLAGCLCLIAVAFALFAPLRAIQFDTNGIVEVQAAESGQILAHNHILYRPLGLASYKAMRFFGYTGSLLDLFQWLDVLLGSLGIGFAYLAFESGVKHKESAVAAAIWLTTSFSYWYFSSDAGYIILAASFAALGLVFAVRYDRIMTAIAAGGCVALAILTWEGAVFLVPVFVVILGRRNAKFAVSFTLACGVIAGLAYAFVGIAVAGVRNVTEFGRWLLQYGSGPTLPMWGVLDPSRSVDAVVSAFRSIIPVLLAVDPRAALSGSIQLGRLAVDAALLCLGLQMVMAIWSIRRTTESRFSNGMYALGYASFLPFIVWWDPGEPKWFVVPNLMLSGFLATAWDSANPLHWFRRLLVASLAVIAITNYVTTFRPRHQELGLARRIAQCVSDHTAPSDLILVHEWGWPDYLGYLHRRNTINIINTSIPFKGDRDKFLTWLRGQVAEVGNKGGRTIMPDSAEYSSEHWDWLEAQTQITRESLKDSFSGERRLQLRWQSDDNHFCESVEEKQLSSLAEVMLHVVT